VTGHTGSLREYSLEVIRVGWLTNTQTGTKEDHHRVNGVKVECSECKTTQYIVPGTPWKCFACDKEHS
jgi:hypothetical protein